MKILYIDLETTGLDSFRDQVLEIGCVVDDTTRPDVPLEDLPKFHCYIKWEPVIGNAFALSMHPKILRYIATDGKDDPGPKVMIYQPDEVSEAFCAWAKDHLDKSITIGGKNVAMFDTRFLEQLPGFDNVNGRIEIRGVGHNWVSHTIKHRVVDPAISFFKPFEDKELPNLDTCLLRAGIEGATDHTAVADCYLVIKLMRKVFNG